MTLRFRSQTTGSSIVLGTEIARGGEGIIYSVEGTSDRVAKVYLHQPDSSKASKIAAMAAVTTSALRQVAAWPIDLVSDDKGKVRGFTMPRFGSRADVHELYSPKSRFQNFPDADFRFIVHVAMNIARAYGTVHAAGFVIGDVNHGHVLVGRDGRVVLIDTDSFQVGVNGKLFTCDVGSALFTPPELQGKAFHGLLRSANHDLFGLAVVLFHMLFMGRHPYAGVWRGQGEMTIEKAIAENRFAYGAVASRLGYTRPPNTLALETFGSGIAALFERAFSAEKNPARPAATDWIAQLSALQQSLRGCQKSQAHYYPAQLATCPWCTFEGQTGVRLFGHQLHTHWTGLVDITQVWRSIEQVARPASDPPLPSAQTWTAPSGANVPSPSLGWLRRVASVMLIVLALGGCSAVGPKNGGIFVGVGLLIAAAVVWPRTSATRKVEIERRLTAAKQQWDQALARWQREATVAAFDHAKQSLIEAKRAYDDLPNERLRRLAKLRTDQQDFQRRRYLDRFRIDRAKIPGIGDGRAAILASFGIETTLDIAERDITSIKGFGPRLTGELLAWRRAQEAKFRFNPAEPIDPGEIARVEGEIASLRSNNLAILKSGTDQLTRLTLEVPAARNRLMPVLKSTWDELKIAEAHKRAA